MKRIIAAALGVGGCDNDGGVNYQAGKKTVTSEALERGEYFKASSAVVSAIVNVKKLRAA
jgi:hypothetical protein